MSYIDFKAIIKKVNLKPGGVQEIVLEVKGQELNGKLDRLSEMIDRRVEVALDSEMISYKITLNSNTNRPIKTYKVDYRGVVTEVEQEEEEQLEADLGLPKAKESTIEEEEEIERAVIDEFIQSGLAPTYDDMTFNFQDIIQRFLEGETYLKLASDLNLSSGRFVDILTEYRKRVAPLAQKWNEWRMSESEKLNSINDEKNSEDEEGNAA